MDWIVEKGVIRIPDGVSHEQASFMEPVNTCWKAIEILALEPSETVLVIGQGPIGIILAALAQRTGARVITSDLFPQRLTIAREFGLKEVINASLTDVVGYVRQETEGRGADAVILAVPGTKLIGAAIDAARPGGKVMLFAQTVREQATIDPAAVCVDEKTLLGSYSASVDLQQDSTDWVFSQALDLTRLITHRFLLAEAVEGLKIAAHPQPDTMKLAIQPGGSWKDR
jgi:L-iditol 2-dehydrogenase